MRALARDIVADDAAFALSCAANVFGMWDGGNQWPGYPAFLSFFRHVAALPLDYAAWDAYEQCAIAGGPRIMHREFCLVSDFPTVLTVDAARQPHGERGPFCAWADGTALWAWHGVRVPPRVILAPDTLTVRDIQTESNAEVRRVMIERWGWDRYLAETQATKQSSDRCGDYYELELDGARIGVAVVTNKTPESDGSFKRYGLRVDAGHLSCASAVARTFGMRADQYRPSLES
jgi:hypothetical protein